VLEKCNEFEIETHHLFIDFTAAHVSMDRYNLYIAMKELKIPRKLIALVKATMSNTLCQIGIQNLLSDHTSIYIKMMSGKEMPWPACCLI
jgi:hypothetical protein